MDLSSFKTQSRAAVSSGKYSSVVVCALFCVCAVLCVVSVCGSEQLRVTMRRPEQTGAVWALLSARSEHGASLTHKLSVKEPEDQPHVSHGVLVFSEREAFTACCFCRLTEHLKSLSLGPQRIFNVCTFIILLRWHMPSKML